MLPCARKFCKNPQHTELLNSAISSLSRTKACICQNITYFCKISLTKLSQLTQFRISSFLTFYFKEVTMDTPVLTQFK